MQQQFTKEDHTMFQMMKWGLLLLVLTAGLAACASTREPASDGLQQVDVGGETRVRASHLD
jgi:uncharacterized lipoprotein YmbA